MINIAFDMETSDPDDAFTLCILATHPSVNLVAVTVTPGSYEQIGVVREILRRLNKSVPVGSQKRCHKDAVSKFHYRWLKKWAHEEPDAEGWEILEQALKNYPDTVLVTGAPLHNIHSLLNAQLGERCPRCDNSNYYDDEGWDGMVI